MRRVIEPSIGARVRAARALKGLSGVPALAAALRKGAAKGLGRTNLYAIERGEEEVVTYGSLVEIANVCEVPIEFFTADFSRLAEISEDPRAVIAAEIAAAVARAEERRAGSSEDPPPPPPEDR